jgi:hypothetical protein
MHNLAYFQHAHNITNFPGSAISEDRLVSSAAMAWSAPFTTVNRRESPVRSASLITPVEMKELRQARRLIQAYSRIAITSERSACTGGHGTEP